MTEDKKKEINEKDEKIRHSCISCGIYNCEKRTGNFPPFCLAGEENNEIIEKSLEIYKGDDTAAKFALAAAQVEGEFYCKAPRVEEIIIFAKKIGAKKIGIASCSGLIEESKIFAKILRAKGLEPFGAICKVGGVDKNEVGIPDETKIRKGGYEPMCNPIAQALFLNEEKTDLNVIMGLCVGHDSLFIKYSDAMVTTLVTKDRVLAHNPVGALYTSGSYYKRLVAEEKNQEL